MGPLERANGIEPLSSSEGLLYALVAGGLMAIGYGLGRVRLAFVKAKENRDDKDGNNRQLRRQDDREHRENRGYRNDRNTQGRNRYQGKRH